MQHNSIVALNENGYPLKQNKNCSHDHHRKSVRSSDQAHSRTSMPLYSWGMRIQSRWVIIIITITSIIIILLLLLLLLTVISIYSVFVSYSELLTPLSTLSHCWS